jgi:mono/diheme cytochrome c family protein
VLTLSAAWVCLFATPFLGGSNHRCPILREQDAKKGPAAQAVPAFARKYDVDCTYCHTVWPQLNRNGLIFRYLGYRMPYEVPVHQGVKEPVKPKAPPAVATGLSPSAKIAEGHKVFMALQCFTCHVDGGNIINPTKPIRGQDFLKKYPDDNQIAELIRHGVPGTAMPAYDKDRLSDDQMPLLIAYIRSLTPQTK